MKRRIAVHKIPQNFLPSRQRTRGGAWFNKWPNRGERETQRNDAKWIAGDVRNPTSSSNRLYSPFEVVNDSFHLADGYTRHWRGVCCSNMKKKKENDREGGRTCVTHPTNEQRRLQRVDVKSLLIMLTEEAHPRSKKRHTHTRLWLYYKSLDL